MAELHGSLRLGCVHGRQLRRLGLRIELRYLGGSPSGYSGRFTDAKVTAEDNGYWLLTSAGQVYAYGDAPFLGNPKNGTTSIS